MTLNGYHAPQNECLEGEHDTPMLESCLTFLATLVSIRTNLGLSDAEMSGLEMITLLCISDKTHSQLMDLMPERYGTTQNRDFESLLAEVSNIYTCKLTIKGLLKNIDIYSWLSTEHRILKQVEICNRECTVLNHMYGTSCLILYTAYYGPLIDEIFKFQWIVLPNSKFINLRGTNRT